MYIFKTIANDIVKSIPIDYVPLKYNTQHPLLHVKDPHNRHWCCSFLVKAMNKLNHKL
jgi:hypothetical protein